ncbi:unnamed protein product [Mytilus coruscus]|uniref:Uncharacterized protein n=1 Tax=Mytilus coruscus TaxID=42192 RepID=A0A6J8BV74_MYTCO|nr:unnamed protein product [Mytilus coruscus]
MQNGCYLCYQGNQKIVNQVAEIQERIDKEVEDQMKKATVIRRSQQPLPSNPVDQDDQVHQDIVTSAVTYTTLTLIQPTNSQPDRPVNTPSLKPVMSSFSQSDHQVTLSSVPVLSTNPFSNQSPTNQPLSLFNPFLDTSHTSTNPFVNTSQSTYDQQYSSFNSPTVNPFLSTNQPFQHSSQANHSQSAITPVQPINSPSHLPDTFRYPEPTTPFPSDIQDRLTPVNRRPLTDRKFDGVYQRLVTLKKKTQTEIKNNQQAIMSMLSTAIHLLQGSNSTQPSTLYQCQRHIHS